MFNLRKIFFICLLLTMPLIPLEALATEDWRLKIKDAAVVVGDDVLLGEIAEPINVPTDIWSALAKRKLWPAPTIAGKAMQINKQRLGEALEQSLGRDLANLCILPSALAIQKNGVVLNQDDLRSIVLKTYQVDLNQMEGRAELSNFRLPAYIFLANKGQRVELDKQPIKPGSISLRFNVLEMDNSVIRRFTGTCFLDHWIDVPAAARPLAKNTELKPEDITFTNVNIAHIKGDVWNGRTGPHELIRSIGTGQVIMQNDLINLALVRKGAIVNLIYNKGNVTLSVQAEVLQSAGQGETVLVRNLQSQKQVYAKVLNPSTVEAF